LGLYFGGASFESRSVHTAILTKDFRGAPPSKLKTFLSIYASHFVGIYVRSKEIDHQDTT